MSKSPTAAVSNADNEPLSSSSSNSNPNPQPTSNETPTTLEVPPPLPATSRPASTHSQPPPPYVQPRRTRASSQVATTTQPIREQKESRKHGIMLRSISLLCEVIAVALFSACIARQDDVYYGYYGSLVEMGLGAISYALVTTVCLFTTDLILLYQHKPAMHPAIPLTFDLLVWGGVFSLTVIVAIFSEPNYGDCYDPDNSSGSYQADCPARNFLETAEKSAVAFSFVSVICHFLLFVRACRHVHVQRKEIREMKATLRAYMEMN